MEQRTCKECGKTYIGLEECPYCHSKETVPFEGAEIGEWQFQIPGSRMIKGIPDHVLQNMAHYSTDATLRRLATELLEVRAVINKIVNIHNDYLQKEIRKGKYNLTQSAVDAGYTNIPE